MSSPAANSPRTWIAAIGILGFLASLLVSFLTIGGVVLAVGVWKGNLDVRVAAVESASKEQITALSTNTDKQVQAVLTAAREMVAAVNGRVEKIEHDRSERLQESARFRNEQNGVNTRLETIVTQQQKQIDKLVDLADRPKR